MTPIWVVVLFAAGLAGALAWAALGGWDIDE